MQFGKIFVNELGNEIRVQVDVYFTNQVKITIEGPDSRTENILTKKETEELRLALNRAHEEDPRYGN